MLFNLCVQTKSSKKQPLLNRWIAFFACRSELEICFAIRRSNILSYCTPTTHAWHEQVFPLHKHMSCSSHWQKYSWILNCSIKKIMSRINEVSENQHHRCKELFVDAILISDCARTRMQYFKRNLMVKCSTRQGQDTKGGLWRGAWFAFELNIG